MKEDRPHPPKASHRFLQWFCPPGLYESVEGDLCESFEADIDQYGIKKARQNFTWNVMRFFRPGIVLRNKLSYTLINTIMFGNYVKVAARNIGKKKLYSFINAFGLSIGIAFCMLIFLFIRDEKSFDQFHTNKHLIYRIESKSMNLWQPDPESPYMKSAWIQLPLAQALKDELPEVEFATRYNDTNEAIFRHEDKVFTEELTYVDADFFRMFSFSLLKGNPEKVFENKTDLVLTEAMAEKYFGNEDPIGKTISIDNNGAKAYTVTGIIEESPANSSLHYKALVRQENRSSYEFHLTRWGNSNTPTFVQLRPNADMGSFKVNLDRILDKHMSEVFKRWRKESAVPVAEDAKLLEFEFTQLPDIHLKKEISWEKVSDPSYSFILGGIAALIMLIACINYVSLALTTSASRRTEVGVRKAVGAQRSQLIYQFGIESLILAFISLVIGIGIMFLFLPAFNDFTGKEIRITPFEFFLMAGVGAGIMIIVGIIAGSYPSLFLSKFKPALVLKGYSTSKIQTGFTRPLVVIQFALSAFLIISSLTMFRQMRFITTKNLGYSQDQVLVIPTQTGYGDEANKTIEQFRARTAGISSVLSVAGTSTSFNHGYSYNGYKINGENKASFVFSVDEHYIPLLDIELKEGRNFDPDIQSDAKGVIVNEALVRDMKWTDPLNEYLNWKEDTVGLGDKVLGVVKDYHYLSLEQEIKPMILSMDKSRAGSLVEMFVKVAPDNISGSLDEIRKVWKELYPDRPFDYTFVDENVARQYESYQRWMSIMGLATSFAILISALGLFGLAGINAVNRTKEIGIRKVMGAEMKSIFVLLNKQYLFLCLISFTMAIPLSWYVMSKWLSDFKFRITMGWELIAVSLLAGILVVILTVSYHAIKAAYVNPAETLKYE